MTTDGLDRIARINADVLMRETAIALLDTATANLGLQENSALKVRHKQ